MKAATSTRIAMAVASVMLAHQVASKAVRDATFLSTWPTTSIPAMGIATAVFVVLLVPAYSRLLARFGPRVIVPAGFLLSAILHAAEWRMLGTSVWVPVLIYLHVAGLGAVLLSGFWSLTSEIFNPLSAKASFGRIAAAGTVGGLVGGLVTARIAVTMDAAAPLLLLTALHAACAVGALGLGRAHRDANAGAPPDASADSGSLWNARALKAAPHLKMLALMVVLSTAGAFVADYLLKSEAQRPEHFGTGPALLEFFAYFYAAVQVVTVIAQTAVSSTVRRAGLGRTISTLPTGLGMTGAVTLLYPVFPMFVVLRGVESVLRGSMFRSVYELLFVPMDPAEKRRVKTFLDVTCDRAGDATGAVFVQVFLLTGMQFQKAELLALIILIALGGVWLSRRLDIVYLDLVQRRLVQQGENTPLAVGSETGWTVLELPARPAPTPAAPAPRPAPSPPKPEDPQLRSLAELRSGDRDRVSAALGKLLRPDSILVAQVVQLLAWDDIVTGVRAVLERVGGGHVGLLVDELLDPETDFAIRRRLPRILGTLSSERAVNGLVRGLDDARFEVRFQCGRAIDRLLSKGVQLRMDPQRILDVVERELSVPLAVWQGYRLIDKVDREDEGALADLIPGRAERNLEHVFTLLSTVLPREPLLVSFHGLRSRDVALRALAVEYLEGVLPTQVRAKLWTVVDAPQPAATRVVSPEDALAALRTAVTLKGAPTPSSGDALD